MKNNRLLVDAKSVFDFAKQSGFYPEFSRGMADLKTLKTLLHEESCAVDAVEVVRCRDCKHYSSRCMCWEIGAETQADNFCSYGERRNNG